MEECRAIDSIGAANAIMGRVCDLLLELEGIVIYQVWLLGRQEPNQAT